MIVNFYSGFAKKRNSTARPTGTATPLTMQLKKDTSVLNPVLEINVSSLSPFNPMKFTYAVIPDFQHYYFVKDWQYNVGTWSVILESDVLATYKTAIGTTSAYIERSASASDGTLIDGLYPAKSNVQISKVNVATSWYYVAPSGGTYVLGVINYETSGHIGAVTYYGLNHAALNALLTFLFSNNIYTSSNITELGEGLFKSLFNPFQYIVSCIWFPFAAESFGTNTSTIKVGYWDTQVSATVVTSLMQSTRVTATIPSHPQVARGSYLNRSPFTRLTLYLPPFGSIPIDPAYLVSGNYLASDVVIDHITGQATIRISISSSSSVDPYMICAERSVMFGVPIQLAQVLSDYTSAMSTALSGGQGGIVGLVTGLIGGTVQSSISSQTPQVSTNGANGSFLMVQQAPVLIVEHTLIADEDNTDLGRPLMSTRTINTLSGYIKCADAHFSAATYAGETDLINSYMVNGFYYE